MAKFRENRILLTDSYKVSHYKQYPPGSQHLYSYWESRGGLYPETVFFGLQYFVKEFLLKPITPEEVDYAEERWSKHLGPGIFNRVGWDRILNEYDGRLPIQIKAVPEGTIVPTRNVMMTVENMDPRLPWLTNYVETLLCELWYPTTVATLSREIKKMIGSYLQETANDLSKLPFMLHDFGFRGTSSVESAGIGGAAHLISFLGTDNAPGFEMAYEFYGEDMAGFSIPAAEHSTITSWGGPEKEIDAFRNMIKQFGGHGGDGTGFYAVVSDSYNFFEACKMWGSELIEEVRNAPNMLVVRPDSGTPHVIVVQGLETLDESDRGGFGHEVNFKGYKVLDGVRMIQGDGVDYDEIGRILSAMKARKWSADNIAFGMGGALLQKLNRDTQNFAFKAASIKGDGFERDVFKAPVTDQMKRSKAGRMRLVRNDDGVLETVHVADRHSIVHSEPDVLEVVFDNGYLLREQTFADIRERAAVTEFANV